MFFALLHGEEFPAFTNRPFDLAASCVEAPAWRGFFLSLQKRMLFSLFKPSRSFFNITSPRGCFLTEKKNHDVASSGSCTGNIYSPHTAWAR